NEFKMELFEEIHQLFAIEKSKKRPSNWIKSSQVKRILRISHGTLQNLRNSKIIPYYPVGGIIFYDLEEINQILVDSRIGSEK
ncbi:helix-turn-helix domain-containing protein, partial [Flavobacteriaceae bacterium F89]